VRHEVREGRVERQPPQREHHEGAGLHQEVQAPARSAVQQALGRQRDAVQEEDREDADVADLVQVQFAARAADLRRDRRDADRREHADQEPVDREARRGLDRVGV